MTVPPTSRARTGTVAVPVAESSAWPERTFESMRQAERRGAQPTLQRSGLYHEYGRIYGTDRYGWQLVCWSWSSR